MSTTDPPPLTRLSDIYARALPLAREALARMTDGRDAQAALDTLTTLIAEAQAIRPRLVGDVPRDGLAALIAQLTELAELIRTAEERGTAALLETKSALDASILGLRGQQAYSRTGTTS